MSNGKDKLLKVIQAIKETSDALDIDPRLVKKKNILANTDLTEWEVRSIGSLKSVVDAYFPTTDKALKEIQELKELKKYVNKLEKMVGEKEYFYDTIEKAILDRVEPVKLKDY